jgi:hypothetical protein
VLDDHDQEFANDAARNNAATFHIRSLTSPLVRELNVCFPLGCRSCANRHSTTMPNVSRFEKYGRGMDVDKHPCRQVLRRGHTVRGSVYNTLSQFGARRINGSRRAEDESNRDFGPHLLKGRTYGRKLLWIKRSAVFGPLC